MAPKTLKLSNRCKLLCPPYNPCTLAKGLPANQRLLCLAPKQPIRNLPELVEITDDLTIEDIKKVVAKAAGFSDHNRIGVYDPTTKKTLKDRKARVVDAQGVVSAGEVLVKDLGTSSRHPTRGSV